MRSMLTKTVLASLLVGAATIAQASPFVMDESGNILLRGAEATYGAGVINTFSLKGGHISESNIADMGGMRLTGIVDGIASTDLATKGQLDTSISLLEYRIAALEGNPDTHSGYFQPKGDAEGASMGRMGRAMMASAMSLGAGSTATPMTFEGFATTDYVDDKFNQVMEESMAYTDKSVKALEDKLSAGIAAAAARPIMPGLLPGEKAVAVGTGHYNGKNALGFAAGFSPQENLIWTAGVSLSDTHGQSLFSVGFNRRF